MPVIYPEGGMPGLMLKQRARQKAVIDTFKVQLVPLRAAPKAKVNGPEDVVSLVREMEDYDRESAKLIHLDTKNQVMGVETISIGSLNMSIVHPRETVKGAILNNSANVIFVHNHPSGVCEPSNEDVEITGKLKEAFETVGIKLLDSIIVGKGCHYSLREAGFLSGRTKTGVSTVAEPDRAPFRGMYPEICPTCRFECVICPYRIKKRSYRFVGIRKIADKAPVVKESTPLQRYKQEYQDFMKKEEAGLRQRLDRITADTGKLIPQSVVIGAAIPVNGHLIGYHLTDNPDEVVRRLKTDNLITMNPHGDLGGGLYISSVPEYWRARSRAKWEFAKALSKPQRQSLVNVILSDSRYRKGGGYLTDFEVERLYRDLNMYVETGDVTYLALTGDQPYNVRITAATTTKAGVPPPREPGLILVELSGKFIDAEGLYSHPLRDEIMNRARAWGIINMPEIMADVKNVVNAWLDSMGYSGMFTRSGMSTNPEMVIWNRKAIVGYRTVT